MVKIKVANQKNVTTFQVYLISLWKSKDALDAHLEQPHTKEFFAAFKEMGATAEVTRLNAAF